MASPVKELLDTEPAFDAAALGILHPGRVHANLSPAALVEHAVRRREGVLTALGALSAFTGSRTGRSPKDKFTVDESAAVDVDWTMNKPLDPASFARLRDLVRAYLQHRDLFVLDA